MSLRRMRFAGHEAYMRKVRNNDKFYERSEVFTAVTMKNGLFWDIKTQFVPHRRHNASRYRVQPVNSM
jgi:hypothetical protein